jgi:polygalacturonase
MKMFARNRPNRLAATARSVVGWLVVAPAVLSLSALAVSPWTLLINTNNVITVTDPPYNAVADGVTDNAIAISNAIVQASKGGTTNSLSGGTVRIPAASKAYICGPIALRSCVNLQVEAGAILRMLPLERYPGRTVSPTGFITGWGLHDIEISGLGAIDGQGAPWWPYANVAGARRPSMIRLSNCDRQLIQNITLSNSPMFHISISGAAARNTTVQNVVIRAPASTNPVLPSHNTDACDVTGTNILVQNCDISVGDDNFTCGGNTSDVLITNNTYGYGHGVSIGSYTAPYVSNMKVINCTFNNTDQGIRIKSDRDRGGFVHNISYCNLTMTNVARPLLIYCQYTNTNPTYRALDNITPTIAASYPSNAVIRTTPIYRDILISNLTATVQSNRAAGLIWGLPEMSISNIVLAKINIKASRTFGVYCAKGVQFVDAQIMTPSGVTNLASCNAAIALTNSGPATGSISLHGVAPVASAKR